MLTIIDYGLGNRGSIYNMLKRLGFDAIISSDHTVIDKAEKLILPGVGSFDTGMDNLNRLGLIPILNRKVMEEKVPILGICLGMQLMTRKSEEGKSEGLSWIDASTVRFRTGTSRIRVPHMGWNYVNVRKDHLLFPDAEETRRFYFVHSYHLELENAGDALCTTEYGYEFVSAIAKGNIYGVQFHPEKSHKFGMQLLKQFAESKECTSIA